MSTSELYDDFQGWRARLDATIAADQLTQQQLRALASTLGQALLTLSEAIRQRQLELDRERRRRNREE